VELKIPSEVPAVTQREIRRATPNLAECRTVQDRGLGSRIGHVLMRNSICQKEKPELNLPLFSFISSEIRAYVYPKFHLLSAGKERIVSAY